MLAAGSAGELYCADEVELLLQEIRELEPTSCRGEEPQDLDIAGSGGGRSPAATERSWDSHAQYRRAPPPRAAPLAPLYCHARLLLRPRGALALLLVASSVAAVACLWAAEGARLGAGARPLALGALSSALLHAALLALHVSRLHSLLPLPWPLIGACCSLWALAWQVAGASLLLHAALNAPPRQLHFAAVGLGYCGAVLAGGLAAAWARRAGRGGGACAGRGGGARTPPAYRAVPTAPPL